MLLPDVSSPLSDLQLAGLIRPAIWPRGRGSGKGEPALVARDDQGKVYTVRYEAVNAMLLNEFLIEHRQVQEQQATITELKSAVAQQQKDFVAAAAQQQKEFDSKIAR